MPRWTRSGTTSTTPASSAGERRRGRSPRCAPGAPRARGSSSSPTRCPTAMDDARGAEGGALPRPSTATSPPCVAAAVGDRLGAPPAWDLVYCSRSGPPDAALAGARRQRPPAGADASAGSRAWSSRPIGFVSDHMEVVYDLDTEARRDRRASSGLPFARAATVGHRPPVRGRAGRPACWSGRRRRAGEAPEQPVVGSARPRPGRSARPAAAATCAPRQPAACGADWTGARGGRAEATASPAR